MDLEEHNTNAGNSINAVITQDPVQEMVIGSTLQFESICPIFNHPEPEVSLLNLDFFDGILLCLHFRETEGDEVDGSAVLIAPGVAICAKHVLEGTRQDNTSRLQRVLEGQTAVLACGFGLHGGLLWKVTNISMRDNMDIAILSLGLVTNSPPNHVFRQATLSTRIPEVGQRLWVVGFKASNHSFPISPNQNSNVSGEIIVSQGEVTQHFLNGRDRVMCPFPCLTVNCRTWGGMSGGPVFDHHGHVIGLLATSFSDPPSFVSLLYPALVLQFNGGWPPRANMHNLNLITNYNEIGCFIHRPEALSLSADGQWRTHVWS